MSINLLLTNLLYAGTLLLSLFSISTSNQVVSVILLIGSFVCAALLLINIGLVFLGLSYVIIYVGAIAVLILFVIMMMDVNIKELSTSDKEFRQNLPLALSISSVFTVIHNSIIFNSPTGFFVPSGININNINKSFELFSFNISEIINNLILKLSIFENNNYTPNTQLKFPDVLHYTSSINGDYFSLYQLANTDSELKSFEQISSLGFGLYNQYPIVYLLVGFILLFSMFSAVILTKRNS